jgi:hypothetical protein
MFGIPLALIFICRPTHDTVQGQIICVMYFGKYCDVYAVGNMACVDNRC